MPTVLVVDDSEMDRRLVGRLLEKADRCRVIYAEDGQAALRHFETSIPDCVLTDLQMPEMSGLELLSAIKTDFPRTPVVLMTAQGSEAIASEALRRGAASYVPKKKLAEDLCETVERVLLAAHEDQTHSRLMHQLVASELSFELGPDRSLVRELVAFLQECLRCMPLEDETDRLRVGIAIEEALKNAHYHGCFEVANGAGWPKPKAIEQIVAERLRDGRYFSRRIFVRARISREESVFVIRDEGPGFDPATAPGLDGASISSATAGRGIILMRTIMDEVHFNARGNEVTLIKRPPDPESDVVEDAESAGE